MPGLGQSLASQGNFLEDSNIVDNTIPTIASAATIAPVTKVNRITGNTTISTITPPSGYFTGPIWLFNTDSSVGVTDTSGNIALATTLTRYKLFAFVFDQVVGKWYPSATS